VVEARRSAPDLIPLDLRLRAGGGLLLIERLKMMPCWLYFLSSLSRLETAWATRRGTLLTKPFTRISLLKKVYSILHGEQVRQENVLIERMRPR
jgi:DNA-binding response OmpR family regulator